MIIIKYRGGLGNQMYQYAMKAALMAQFPNQNFKDDISHYKLLKEHNGFELDRYFDIEFDFARKKDIKKVYNGYTPGVLVNILPSFIRKKIVYKYQHYYRKISDKIHPRRIKTTLEEPSIETTDFSFLESGDWYVSGMWQSLKWFDAYREILLDKFKWKVCLDETDEAICRKLESGEFVAVHVRGGDYINNGLNNYELCTQKYYLKAIESFGCSSPSIYVFTDDIEYARSMFDGVDSIKIEGFISHHVSESVKDMYMLSRAKKLVTANSTFSFWGAYLNRNESAEIVAPKYAFHNGKEYIKFNYRENWTILNNERELQC